MFPIPISSASPVDQARAEIQQLAARELQLIEQRKTKAAELAAAEQAAGEQYLADGKASIGRIVRLKAELDAISRAVEGCHARRVKAVEALHAARIEELRDQAAEKQRELQDLEKRTAKHLAALSELEGVPYDQTILSAQRAGDFLAGNHTPRSAQLRAEIQALEVKASELRQFGPPQGGTVDLETTSTDDLLAAVPRQESLTPSVAEILEWVEACERAAVKRGHRDGFGQHPRRFRLVWRKGAIDAQQSYIFCGRFGLEAGAGYNVQSGQMIAGQHCNADRATFKAEAA